MAATASTMRWTTTLLTTGALLLAAVAGEEVRGSVDVMEGEDAVLRCRFDSALVDPDDVSFYWSHRNTREWDNVAIQKDVFRKPYRVDFRPDQGRYDLHVNGATYERDNGQFQCKARRVGSGRDLHAETVQLTVLMAPATPVLQPPAAPLTEGRPAELTCSSLGGSPPPELRWYRAGSSSPLPARLTPAADRRQPTVSRLTLTPGRHDDGRQLQCVAWNRAMAAGERLTASLPLSVQYYPRVTVGPSSPLSVEVGGSVKLTCRVDSKPAVANVRWVRNGAFINTAFEHRIDVVERADAGVYTCSAENAVADKSADLTLDVQYAPVVRVEPEHTLELGASLRVDCRVDANPPAERVYWLRRGEPTFRQEGGSLRLDRLAAADAGAYVCVAVNRVVAAAGGRRRERVGNATAAVHVRHAPGPAFITPDAPVGVEGRPLTLSCGARPPGYPAPKYRWWWRRRPDVPLGFGANYTVGSVLARHAGEYLCQPENELGSGAAAAAVVRVLRAPRLGTRLQPHVERPLHTTAFSAACSAQGRPRPAVSWLKDGDDLQTADGHYEVAIDETERKDGSFEVRSTLSFRGRARRDDRLTPADRGNFTCRFQNAAGLAETTMLLRIRHAPIVYHQYNKVAFDLDEAATIVCQMQAFPAPTFSWSRRGLALAADSAFYATNATRLGNDVHQSTLQLARVRPADYGEYVCQARNGEGEHSTSLRLQAKGRPEPPTDVRAVELGTDWALLDWTAGFDGGFSDVFHHVSLLDGRDKERAFDCQTRRPCNVTSLQHRSTYRVRVRANNKKGQSELSQQTQFTTRLDVSQLPQPQRVQFSRQSRQLSFHVISSPIDVVGTLDFRSDEGDWQPSEQQVTVTNNRGLAALAAQLGDVDDVRVRLCLRTDTNVCSAAVVAEHVAAGATVAAAGGTPMTTIIVVAVAAIAAVAVLVLLFICCCRRGASKAAVKKGYTDASYDRQQPSAFYQPDTVPHKTVTDPTPALYGGRPAKSDYGAPSLRGATVAPGPGHTAYTEQSYSNSNPNSNTGGSVNSQDSLWQVKAGDGRPPPQQHNATAFESGPVGNAPELTGYGDYGEYGHYPPQHEPYPYPAQRDDYSRQLDPAMPYGAAVAQGGFRGVSGVPDPYAGQEPENKPQLSFDESLESGYSTPNARSRRVIREIIV